MVTHSCILIWEIQWTVEPRWLPSRGSQRVGHHWACMCACAHTHTHTHTVLFYDSWLLSKSKDYLLHLFIKLYFHLFNRWFAWLQRCMTFAQIWISCPWPGLDSVYTANCFPTIESYSLEVILFSKKELFTKFSWKWKETLIECLLACVCMCCVLSHAQLLVIPWTCLPGSSAHRIFQARILEWVAISYFRGFSQHRDWTQISWIFCLAGDSVSLNHLESPLLAQIIWNSQYLNIFYIEKWNFIILYSRYF